jgi:hypothetical protein
MDRKKYGDREIAVMFAQDRRKKPDEMKRMQDRRSSFYCVELACEPFHLLSLCLCAGDLADPLRHDADRALRAVDPHPRAVDLHLLDDDRTLATKRKLPESCGLQLNSPKTDAFGDLKTEFPSARGGGEEGNKKKQRRLK